MTSVNYIKHLKAVFQLFSKDSRLHPTHISLYISLFQYWNINRFPESFFINREEVMKMAKIGSLATYHRCIRGLDEWKYISYIPSHNIYKGSEIRMFKFETTCDTTCDTIPETTTNTISETTSETTRELAPEQPQVHYINNNKPNKHFKTRNKKEVIDFFKKNNWSVMEALKFFNHYEAIGWKMGGKAEIENWFALAEGWMVISKELKERKLKMPDSKVDNLQTIKNKNYDEPL